MSHTSVFMPGSRQHRGFSADLWQSALHNYAASGGDPWFGRFEFTDCDEEFANPGDAAATAIDKPWFIQDLAAGGTVESLVKNEASDYYADNGVWTLSATTGTDHFGIGMHRGLTATTGAELQFPSVSAAVNHAGPLVIMELMIDIDDVPSWFIGFTEPIAEFLSATSTLPTDSDFLGLYKADDASDITLEIHNDNGAGTAAAVSATVLANADIPNNDWLKLGIRVHRYKRTVDVAIDGTIYQERDLTFAAGAGGAAGDTVSTSLPIERLCRRIDISRGATSDPASISLDIDWMALFVEGGPDVI